MCSKDLKLCKKTGLYADNNGSRNSSFDTLAFLAKWLQQVEYTQQTGSQYLIIFLKLGEGVDEAEFRYCISVVCWQFNRAKRINAAFTDDKYSSCKSLE